MRVALIGGAFDPPHNGHILCVSNLFNSKLVDQVWLVPSGDGRYDKKSEASSLLRRKMLEIVLENDFQRDSRIKIELSQIENPKDPCYTSELLKSLAKQYPSNEFFITVGSDNLRHIKNWHEGEWLIQNAGFIVVPRPGARAEDLCAQQTPTKKICLNENDLVSTDISSSFVRKLIREGRDVAGLIPAYLIQFCRANSLYLNVR